MSRERLLGKSPDELRTLVRETRQQLFRLRMQHAVGQLPKTHEIRAARRTLARALTRLNDARRGQEKRS
jgi:large subunit ribosomal protein L29